MLVCRVVNRPGVVLEADRAGARNGRGRERTLVPLLRESALFAIFLQLGRHGALRFAILLARIIAVVAGVDVSNLLGDHFIRVAVIFILDGLLELFDCRLVRQRGRELPLGQTLSSVRALILFFFHLILNEAVSLQSE